MSNLPVIYYNKVSQDSWLSKTSSYAQALYLGGIYRDSEPPRVTTPTNPLTHGLGHRQQSLAPRNHSRPAKYYPWWKDHHR